MLTCFFLLGGMLFGGLNDLTFYDLANWDGRHFLQIAQIGYADKIQYAFFPLYPLLINFISNLLKIDFIYSALLINFVSSFGIIYTFLKLLQEYKDKNPVKTLIYFLIFPTSFYFVAVYSESLFLFLSLLTFFFAEKRRFLLSAFFASLSSLTRVTGIAVIFTLIFYVFYSKTTLKEKIVVVALSALGLFLYCVYLFIQTGSPFYFLVSELTWGRNITFPGANIRDSVFYIVGVGLKPESFTILSDLIFTVFGLGMGLRAIRFLKPPLAVYTTLSLLIPLSTALLLSFPRFLVVIFPVFIILSKINNRIFTSSYVIISIVLLFLYFNFFLRNIWVS